MIGAADYTDVTRFWHGPQSLRRSIRMAAAGRMRNGKNPRPARDEIMARSKISRRAFVGGGVGLTVANFVPGTTPLAFAATLEERVVAAAKPLGTTGVTGMIWSPYLVPMQPVIAEFT